MFGFSLGIYHAYVMNLAMSIDENSGPAGSGRPLENTDASLTNPASKAEIGPLTPHLPTPARPTP
jgi:hypothetical protein